MILDGEILAFREGRVLPFHDLQTRLGRRNPSQAAREAVPVIYVAWDLLLHGDESLLDTPLRERRRRLEALSLGDGFALAHLEPAVGAAAVDERFAAARARRNEGLMLKDPDSAYTPGRRGLAWLKLKRPLDTLDVVVVGAEWGHGKRRGVLSDVTFAVRNGDGELVTVGKAYTGLTDAEIAEMTALLLDITLEDRGHYRTVRPQIVLEVAFDAVQPSSRHRSGYALRFPRIARWRHDKPVEEIDTSTASQPSPRARRTTASSSSTRPAEPVAQTGRKRGEQLGSVHGRVTHLLEGAEPRSQGRVLCGQGGIAVRLGGIPRDAGTAPRRSPPGASPSGSRSTAGWWR